MEKYRAIPSGYMTVGEIAKKMGVTVRTLQHYDKEKLLCPSAESEGGRRLYTDKDVIKLHQILSLKSLGFSLEDIRERLIPLDNPKEVVEVLDKQAIAIQKKIEELSEALSEIEKLKIEVRQMQSVDFKKYADIITNLQMKNEFYYLIKRFDEKTMNHIRNRFDWESGQAFIAKYNRIVDKIIRLQKERISCDSARAQKLAEEYWETIMEFTNGDMSILSNLIEVGNSFGESADEQEQRYAEANAYIEPALEIYFTKKGVNPYEEKTK